MPRLLSRLSVALIASLELAAQARLTDPAHFVPRFGAQAAMDAGTGALYVVGGRYDAVLDLWRLQGGTWQRLADLPVTGLVSGLAYDPVRARLVASIGTENQESRLYEFDGTNWDTGFASPVWLPQLLHDPVRNLLIAFGATSPFSNGGQLWAWNGTSLAPLPMTGAPWAGIWGDIAFDAVSGRVVVAKPWFNEVHEWNGTVWTTTVATSPIGNGQAATDPVTGRVVYVNGAYTVPIAHTWTGQAFVPFPMTGMPHRFGGAVCGNTAAGALQIIGGRDLSSHPRGDVWQSSPSGWQQVVPDTTDPQFAAPLVVATGPGEALAFDGGGYVAGTPTRTARWQNGVWTVLQPTTSPSSRIGFAFAGDPATGRAYLFGGQTVSGTLLGDFWLWNGTNWQQLPGGPSPRQGHTMCFRSEAGRLVLYGGTQANETWEWDGTSWQLRATGFPPHVGTATFAHDDVRRRSVLTTFGLLGVEMWEWDGINWFSTNPPTRPSIPQQSALAAFDPMRERVVVVETGHWTPAPSHEWDGTSWRSFPLDTRLRSNSLAVAGIPEVGAVVIHLQSAITLTLTNSAPATTTSFANACPDPQRRLSSNHPWLGTTCTLRYPAANGALCLFATGASNTQYGGVPLPIDLGIVGLPGCSLLVAPDLLDLRTATAGAATRPIALPANPALVGVQLFHQAADLSAGFTATSQGLRHVTGTLW